MELKIKHNNELHTYEGTSVIFAVQRGDYAEGALMGSKVECMSLLISLIKKCLETSDLNEASAFLKLLKEVLESKVEEVGHAEKL